MSPIASAAQLRLIVVASVRQAQQALRQLSADLKNVDRSNARTASSVGQLNAAWGRALRQGSAFGSQLQWTGRQLEYNFTLPILAAGVASTKWALDNEKAFVRVRKVYGDLDMSRKTFENETKSLEGAFTQLSNFYGQSKAAVTGIAADWAAAGVSGLALARSTETTLKAMVLGEMDAKKATQALISIQAQYNLSSKELNDTLAQMNIIENQTGISMAGLIEGFERTAGVARNAGINTRELGAMLAALVPAAGTAANAGNALKTIISRLLVPTKEAREVLSMVGINVADAGWQSLSASKRLEVLAKKFTQLNAGQKAAVSATVASRWQLNKFDVLMEQMVRRHSFYQKALDATADKTAYLKQAQKELNQVLSSNPQRMQQMWVILQNAASDIIQPLIPMIVMLAQKLGSMAQAFADLPPNIQKATGLLLLFLAATGPLVRYIGSLATLFFTFGRGLHIMLGPLGLVAAKFLEFVKLPFVALASGLRVISKAFIGLSLIIGPAVLKAGATVGTLLLALGRTYVQLFFAILSSAFDVRRLAVSMAGAVVAFSKIWWAIGDLITKGSMAFAAAVVTGLKRLPMLLLRFLVGPWGIAIGAIATVIYAFRDQLGQLWSNVSAALIRPWNDVIQVFGDSAGFFQQFTQYLKNIFWSLPVEIQRAFLAVVKVVQSAAMAVYQWFSYLNPFARHSPSLVDNVTKGVAVIVSQFGTLSSIQSPIDKAYAQIKRLKDLTASFQASQAQAERKSQLDNLAKVAPRAVAAYKALAATMDQLQARADKLNEAIRKQQQVADAWQAKLDEVNKQLDIENKKLEDLQNTADGYASVISAAQDKISQLASAPLQGMREMDDQIFANEMAQKKLRLEMMKMEDAGQSYDSIASKISSLNGDIEKLQATQSDMRQAGAGSDILKFYDDEISKIKAQQGQLNKQADQYSQLGDALDELQRKAEELDLEKSLKFDELSRQIDQLANSQKELSFDEIVAGIKDAQTQIGIYQPKLDAVNQAIDRQQQVVDALKKTQDQLQASYDVANDKLQKMKDNYTELTSAISDASAALDDIASKAGSAVDAAKGKKKGGSAGALTPGAQAFKDASGSANFPVPGGTGSLGREGGLGDQSKLIDQYTKGLSDQIAAQIGGIDLFKPIKDKWEEVKAWFQKNIQPAFGPIKDGILGLFKGIDWGKAFGPGSGIGAVIDWFKGSWDGIKKALLTIWQAIKDIFGSDVKDIIVEVFKALKDAFTDVMPAIKDLVGDFKDYLPVLKVLAEIIITVVLVALKSLASFLKRVLPPIIRIVGGVIKNVIKILHGFMQILAGVLTGDPKKIFKGFIKIFDGLLGLVGTLLSGVVDLVIGIFRGIWDTLGGLIKAGGRMVFGDAWAEAFGNALKTVNDTYDAIVKTVSGWWDGIKKWFEKVWQGAIDGFNHLYDVLVGHSIIPDLIDAIIDCFKDLLKRITKPLKDAYAKIKKPFDDIWTWVKNTWSKNWGKIKDFFTKPITDFKSWWSTWWTNLKVGFDLVWGWVKGTFTKNWTRVKDFLKDPITSFKSWWETWWTNLKTGFDSIWNWIKNTWSKTWSGLKGIITKPLEDAKKALEDILTGKNGIAKVFERAVTAIGNAWDDIKSVAKSPVHFVIDTVINKGIIGAYNSFVKRLFGSGTKLTISPFPLPFKEGGKIPGGPGRGTGTSDSILGLDSRGVPTARVSAHEYIVNAKSTKKYEPYIQMINDDTFDKVLPNIQKLAKGGSVGERHAWPTSSRHINASYPGHTGVDIQGRDGAPIYAALRGKVAFAGFGHGYGRAIFLRGADGLTQIYGHSSRTYVRAGSTPRTGQLIGLVGHTGNVRPPGPAGAHLHFEIARYGVANSRNRGYTLNWLRGSASVPGGGGATPVPGGGSFPGDISGFQPDYRTEYNKFAKKLDLTINKYSGGATRWEQMVRGWPKVVGSAVKSYAKKKLKLNAAGTEGTQYGWSIAGENGAELINKGAGAKIFSSRRSTGMLADAFSGQVSRAFDAGLARAVPRLEDAVVSAMTATAARVEQRTATVAAQPGTRAQSGNTYINIEKVEFPNITAPDDAEDFVNNLEALSRGKGYDGRTS